MIHIKSYVPEGRPPISLRGKAKKHGPSTIDLWHLTPTARNANGPCKFNRILPDNLKEYHETN